MFGLHMPELVVILVIALLVFGPKKLPEIAKGIGKSVTNFKKGLKETVDEVPNIDEAEIDEAKINEAKINEDESKK